jgi:hypothetical protein
VLKKTNCWGVQEMAVKSVDRLAVLDEGMTFHPIAITPQEINHRNASLLYRRGGAYVLLHRTK